MPLFVCIIMRINVAGNSRFRFQNQALLNASEAKRSLILFSGPQCAHRARPFPCARLSDFARAAKFASSRERVIACCPDCWLMRVEFGLIGNLAIQAPVHLIKIQLTASLCAHGLHLPSHAFAFPQNHSPLTLGDFMYTHAYICI